jgi:hypothetical protein
VLGAGFAFGAHSLTGGGGTKQAAGEPNAKSKAALAQAARRALPREMRGVHVTMTLASLHGKLDEYLALKRAGLNTIELDVKDENGEVGFVRGAPPLARATGAAKPTTTRAPRHGGARGRSLPDRAGRHLPGSARLRAAPGLALHNRTAPSGRPGAGYGWLNPYDRRVWNYDLAVATAAKPVRRGPVRLRALPRTEM